MGPMNRGRSYKADGQSYICGVGELLGLQNCSTAWEIWGRMPQQGVRREQPGQGEISAFQINLAYLAKPNV